MSHPEPGEMQLAELYPLTRIQVCAGGKSFVFTITDPRNAEAMWRTDKRMYRCRIGTRFYQGDEARRFVFAEPNEGDITWGLLAPGRELLIGRSDDSSTIVGGPIESIRDIGHGTQYQQETPVREVDAVESRRARIDPLDGCLM